jgi:hypothetical protein
MNIFARQPFFVVLRFSGKKVLSQNVSRFCRHHFSILYGAALIPFPPQKFARHVILTDCGKKLEGWMTWSGITFIPNVIKIGQLVQKLKGGHS